MPSAGSTTERGYGAKHQAKRREYQLIVDAGAAECWRPECGKPINPGDDWQLGHDPNDRTKYKGVECVHCNESDGGRNGAAVTNAAKAMTVREW